MTAIVNQWRCRAGALLLGVGLALVICRPVAAQSEAGGYFVPGDPKAGMRVFFDKGCGRCHSVLGEGAHSAPDLARAPAGHVSASEILADMWNHAPAMWERMRAENIASQPFQPEEMTNLFAFLYSVRSLDAPGDAERGRQLVREKGCVQCHSVGGEGGRAAPDLQRWSSYRNPVSWIQAMWNHGPAMRERMSQQGLRWPEFRDNDVADVIAYVRRLTHASKQQKLYLRPADPVAGRAVFEAKGCLACHGARARGTNRAPDLGSRAMPRTLGQFAADMWNHGPRMWRGMGGRPRQFTNKEMADLIAYLFAERFFETAGSAQRGERLFQQKGCANCHGKLTAGRAELQRSSATALATSLWNHGPLMLEAMRQQDVHWPAFRRGEMADLIEYLSRRRVPKPGEAR